MREREGDPSPSATEKVSLVYRDAPPITNTRERVGEQSSEKNPERPVLRGCFRGFEVFDFAALIAADGDCPASGDAEQE
jgi:hypothetical protein